MRKQIEMLPTTLMEKEYVLAVQSLLKKRKEGKYDKRKKNFAEQLKKQKTKIETCIYNEFTLSDKRSTKTLGLTRDEVVEHFFKKLRRKRRPTKPPGRPRILWEEPVKWMLEALKKNSSASNEMLAGVVHNMIKPQSVSNYLKRNNVTEKRITDGGAQKMDDRIIGETRDFYLKVKDIPWNKRVYMDESFVYNNEAPTYGRSVAGEPINRVRDKRGKRLTLYLAIRVDGLVHMPILKPENADDVEFMKYVEQTLVPHLRFGEVVIWDRLGRSGRAKNPCKQHYNPLARQMIEDKLCQLLILPPKGKYFDPIELVFSLLKHDVRKTYAESSAAVEQRPRTEVEIRDAVRSAALKITSTHLHGFFKERANGRSFRKVYPELVNKIFI